MLYECACGFSSNTATTLYRHLASQKDSGEHLLVQARLSSDASSLGSPSHMTMHAHVTASSLPHSPAAPSPPPLHPIFAAGSPNSKKMTGARRRMKSTTTPNKRDTPEAIPEGIKEEVIEQVDCRQRQQDTQDGAPSEAHDSFISKVGAAFGSLVLSGINPIRLFGLASGAASMLHCPAPPPEQDTARLQSHPGPSSTSGPSLVDDKGPRVDDRGPRQHSHDDVSLRQRSSEAKNMILATEAALLWIDPYKSLRVLALCLYLAVCIYRFFAPTLSPSSIFITPSTFVLGSALLYLARNGMRTMTNGGLSEEDRSVEEINTYLKVKHLLEAVSATVIPVISSLAALGHRALSGRKLTNSSVVALGLWIAMVGIEMHALPATGFFSTALLILAAFSLPALYVRCREGLDLMVQDSTRLLLRLFLSSSRQTIVLSIGAAFLVMNRAPLGIVLKTTTSVITAVSVLIWRSNPAQSQAQRVASPAA